MRAIRAGESLDGYKILMQAREVEQSFSSRRTRPFDADYVTGTVKNRYCFDSL